MSSVPAIQQFTEQLNGNADATSTWVRCRPYHIVSFGLGWDLVAATAGEFFLEGTNSELQTANTVQRFANADLDWWFNGALALPRPVAAAGTALLVVVNPMAFHRIVYVRGAGGAANQFRLDTTLRGT